MAIYLKVDSSDIIRTTVDIFNYFVPEEMPGFFNRLLGTFNPEVFVSF